MDQFVYQIRIRLDGKRALRTERLSQLTSRQAQNSDLAWDCQPQREQYRLGAKRARLLCPDVVKGLAADAAAAHRPRDVLGKAFAVLAQVVGGV